MLRNTKIKAGLGVLAISMLATACGGDGGSAEASGDELPIIRFQVIDSDPASIPLQVMMDEGLDEEHGFKAEPVVVDPDASTSTFLLGESDIATDQDGITLTIAQQQGEHALGFAPALNMMTGVVASADSGIETAEDLAGAKVGHFGLDSGTTSAIGVMLEELYDIDISDDMELKEAGAAALPELMASGEVDAIFNYEPFALRATLMGGHYVFQPAKAWAEKTGGYAPNLALLAARSEWLEENPGLAVEARDAWFEAVKVIEDSGYELLKEPEYAEILALRDEAELDAFVQYCADLPCYSASWDESDVEGTQEWLQLFADRDLLIEEMPEKPVTTVLEEQ